MSPLTALAISELALAVFSAVAIDYALAGMLIGLACFSIFLKWRYVGF